MMSDYQHILLAADFFDQHEVVAEKAKYLAEIYQCQLSLVHVIDYPPVNDPGYNSALLYDRDLTAIMYENAGNKLSQLANKFNIAEHNTHLEIGSPKAEIIRIAQQIGADLIVVGSHGRHGLALLLGSTANSVLHHANCDVLAVRLSDD